MTRFRKFASAGLLAAGLAATVWILASRFGGSDGARAARLLGLLACDGDPYLKESSCFATAAFAYDKAEWRPCRASDVAQQTTWKICHEDYEIAEFTLERQNGESACTRMIGPEERQLYQGDGPGKGGEIDLLSVGRRVSVPVTIVAGGDCKDPRRWTMAWPPDAPADETRRLDETIDKRFASIDVVKTRVARAAPRAVDASNAALVWGIDGEGRSRLFGVLNLTEMVDLGAGDYHLLSGTDLDQNGDAEILLVEFDQGTQRAPRSFRLLDGAFRDLAKNP